MRFNGCGLQLSRKCFCAFMAGVFLVTSAVTAPAQPVLGLPEPGQKVALSPAFTPAHLRGLVVHPDEPFKLDFIIQRGDTELSAGQKQEEYSRLIKYFLASLAVPDRDQWVNLSPFEKDRVIADNFGLTEMGRDLLAQDYLLKQFTASLTDPASDLGKKFWARVYEQAYDKFGTTDIPTDTFNKVWIVPDHAAVCEKGNTVYVLEHHLKVLTETDYLALKQKEPDSAVSGAPAAQAAEGGSALVQEISIQAVREVILPELEKEVNEGAGFALLRQAYSGMLLAAWYKRTLMNSILAKVYGDSSKVKGVDQDPANNQQIYERYVAAFKKGVVNLIQEDVDRYSQELIPRKYFSGGILSDASMFEADRVERLPNMPRDSASKAAQTADMASVQLMAPGDPAAALERSETALVQTDGAAIAERSTSLSKWTGESLVEAFQGDVWIQAGQFWYKVWVDEGGTVKFQAYLGKNGNVLKGAEEGVANLEQDVVVGDAPVVSGQEVSYSIKDEWLPVSRFQFKVNRTVEAQYVIAIKYLGPQIIYSQSWATIIWRPAYQRVDLMTGKSINLPVGLKGSVWVTAGDYKKYIYRVQIVDGRLTVTRWSADMRKELATGPSVELSTERAAVTVGRSNFGDREGEEDKNMSSNHFMIRWVKSSEDSEDSEDKVMINVKNLSKNNPVSVQWDSSASSKDQSGKPELVWRGQHALSAGDALQILTKGEFPKITEGARPTARELMRHAGGILDGRVFSVTSSPRAAAMYALKQFLGPKDYGKKLASELAVMWWKQVMMVVGFNVLYLLADDSTGWRSEDSVRQEREAKALLLMTRKMVRVAGSRLRVAEALRLASSYDGITVHMVYRANVPASQIVGKRPWIDHYLLASGSAREMQVNRVDPQQIQYAEVYIAGLTPEQQGLLRRNMADSEASEAKAEDPLLEKADLAGLTRGGIDFSQSRLDLAIKRDGNGLVLPLDRQDLEGIRIDGLIPVILKIQPAAALLDLT
ncbi:MAG: hypothetical protein HQL20_08875 [Candidatus Omnitrophica bacterium]|nr:hypothetical protein [Candidatus Omnitrophota bacterium]